MRKDMEKLNILPLQGVVQHYDWGGFSYLPELLGQDNAAGHPFAELWLGAHPKGPSRLQWKNKETDLRRLLDQRAEELLGTAVAERFDGDLPFLLKVLDVRQMLSIQAHPTIERARAGFEREEQAGIPADAPNRNYRDRNHKPELGLALTDFYLVHGFRSADAIADTLRHQPGWAGLEAQLNEGGIRGLYQFIMELDQQQVDQLLEPVYGRLRQLHTRGQLNDKSTADYWAWRAFQQYSQDGQHDRGVFSLYWFNIVHLQPGEAIFQAAGIPHAYLEGVNIELMANSDNVLRGGLTPKHIDVPELLDNLVFEPVSPHILRAEKTTAVWKCYESPVEDFRLCRGDLSTGETARLENGPAVYLLMQGRVQAGEYAFGPGEAFFLPAGLPAVVTASEETVLYRAAANYQNPSA